MAAPPQHSSHQWPEAGNFPWLLSSLLLWERKVIELKKEFQVVVCRLDFDLLHKVMSWPEVWCSRTGSKASFEPLVWKKTSYVKVWAPHTKDGGPLGIRDISMMSFGVDELCKRVSQKHKHAAHLTVSTWKSWWSKLNLSLYCQISPIKPLLHLDPNVRINWRWTGYTCIFVCYSCVLSGSGNWNKEFPFLYQDFIINLFVLNFHCIKVIKGTMS